MISSARAVSTLVVLLAATATAAAAAAPAQSAASVKAKAAATAKQRAAQLNAQQAQTLAAKNRQVRASLARLSSSQGAPVPLRTTPLTASALIGIRGFRPGGDNPATLSSLSPNPVTVGGEVTLHGSNLGEGQPAVDVILQGAMVSVECSVRRWSATNVVATVPAGIEALVGDRGEDVLFRVEPAGRDDGPALAARLVVSSVPSITGTSAGAIEPGQLLILQGTGFGTTAGHASLRLPSLGVTREMVVDSWAETAIVVHLAEGTTGLPRMTPCTLQLTNSAGRNASRDLNCWATLVNEVVTQTFEHRADPGDGTAQWTDTAFPGETLDNGWRVSAVGTEGTTLGAPARRCTCTILDRTSDSLQMSVRTSVREDPHSYFTVTCTVFASLNGPLGTDY